MSKYILQKKFTFEAAHNLPHHDGKCFRRHGHSFVGWIEVESETLYTEGPKQGMVVDYSDIKTALTPLLDNYLDHYDLNETTGLENPTSENLAKWVFDKIKPQLPQLTKVIIEETCTSKCIYTG